MHKLKKAKRLELNNFISSQLIKYLTKDKQPPYNATRIMRGSLGTWWRVELPAGVVALAYKGVQGHMVGYYHSNADAADDIKGLNNALRRKPKASR